jgi:hypothetical protein
LSESQLAKIDVNITDTFKFKKMGNEEQYKHNQKVFVKMREIRLCSTVCFGHSLLQCPFSLQLKHLPGLIGLFTDTRIGFPVGVDFLCSYGVKR